MHPAGLLATIAAALGGALVAGYAAKRLGLSPILGYLVAGIAIGPHTPGFIADATLAAELAEMGVVLLMFGVGLHFSLRDLYDVRSVAIPGAVGQSLLATGLGIGVAYISGWSLGAGLVLGLSLSVASTVVLLRGLLDRGLLESVHGHVSVGWLVVEDVFTVLILVLLPAISGPLGGIEQGAGHGILASLGIALLKMGLFVVLVLTLGARAVPWLLARVARVESRELFTLAVLAVALGVAYGAAALFDVSMALGAFLAGMVVSRSDLSHRAAADALPLRDAFAVLFFVSVGMLFDPAFVAERPGLVLATTLIVLVAKPLIAFAIVIVLGHPLKTGLTAAAGLAQVGEFSFILASLGRRLGLLPAEGESVVLAVALISIAVNPFLFRAIDPLEARWRRVPWLVRKGTSRAQKSAADQPSPSGAALHGHAVLCGHGRVGGVLAQLLEERRWPYVVIEQDRRRVEALRRRGIVAWNGDAGSPEILDLARLADAKLLLIALADPVATRLAAAHAARVNPSLRVVARVDSEAEREALRVLPNVQPVVGTLEVAFQMARRLLEGFGVGPLESEAAEIDLRRAHGDEPSDARTRFVEVEVPVGGAAAGRRILDLGLPQGALLVLVRRGGGYLVPSGTTKLEPGDAVLALASPEALERLRAVVGALGTSSETSIASAAAPSGEAAEPAAGAH